MTVDRYRRTLAALPGSAEGRISTPVQPVLWALCNVGLAGDNCRWPVPEAVGQSGGQEFAARLG